MKCIFVPLIFFGLSMARGAEWKIRKDVLFHESVVAGTKIRLLVSEKPFDPTKHRTEERANIGTADKPKIGPTIDFKPVIGNSVETEGRLPPAGCPQLGRIVVYFGDVAVDVPPQLLNNVFFPRLQSPGRFSLEYADSIVAVSSDAKCVQISMGVGEGGGQAVAFFAVSRDGGVDEQPPVRELPGR